MSFLEKSMFLFGDFVLKFEREFVQGSDLAPLWLYAHQAQLKIFSVRKKIHFHCV